MVENLTDHSNTYQSSVKTHVKTQSTKMTTNGNLCPSMRHAQSRTMLKWIMVF